MLGLVLLLVTLVAAGCGPSCPVQPHTDPARAIAFHRGLREHASVIRAEATVDQRGEDGRIRGTVLMFVERPDHVRFDAMTQFGPAAILTSDGARFALTDLRENRYLTGRSCPANIARLLGIRMSGEEVARFLRGDTPLIEATDVTLECSDDGTYLIVRRNGPLRQEIELDVRESDRELPPEAQHLRLVRSELFDAEGTVWRARFDDYRVVRDPRSEAGLGVAMPFRVHFEHPREDADTLVRFQEIDMNVEVPGEAFQQSPRPGIGVEEVACEE